MERWNWTIREFEESDIRVVLDLINIAAEQENNPGEIEMEENLKSLAAMQEQHKVKNG